MAATKKTATKKVTKKAVVKDPVFYVVMERKLTSVSAVGLYQNRADAQTAAEYLDDQAGLSFNKYVVQRVELTTLDKTV